MAVSNLHSRNRAWCQLSTLLLFVVVGCGDAGVLVEGRVDFGDEPLDGGSVFFHGMKDSVTHTAEIDRGLFRFEQSDGLLPGDYIVEIRASVPTGRTSQDPDIPTRTVQEKVQLLRKDLKATIGENGASDLAFHLEDPRKRRR